MRSASRVRRTRIKICGLTRVPRMCELAVELGADALGFVLWPGSPRFVDQRAAQGFDCVRCRPS